MLFRKLRIKRKYLKFEIEKWQYMTDYSLSESDYFVTLSSKGLLKNGIPYMFDYLCEANKVLGVRSNKLISTENLINKVCCNCPMRNKFLTNYNKYTKYCYSPNTIAKGEIGNLLQQRLKLTKVDKQGNVDERLYRVELSKVNKQYLDNLKNVYNKSIITKILNIARKVFGTKTVYEQDNSLFYLTICVTFIC